jgi:5-methylthioadenosine/S-adenosylhomocysteine deaminase
MKLQIKNSLILTVNPQNEVLENADIAIANGCILAVGKVPENFEADKVIDATDQIAMPGLVNAHTHIPMSLFRNYADDLPFWPWLLEKIKPAEDHLSAEHVYWGAKLGILELIQSGVTCFSDMYFYMGEAAKVVEESGIKACLSGVLLEVSDLGPTFMKAAVDFHDSWHGKAGGRIKVFFGPHSMYLCGPEYLRETTEEALKRKTRIHIHLSESRQEVADSLEKYGKSPVQHLADLGLFECPTAAAHCVHLSVEDIELLRKYKVSVLNNPTSNLKLANGFAPVEELLKKGVNVALGTDGSASNNNVNLFEEMHLAALVNKAINDNTESVPAQQVLRMGTINGAKALGLEKEIGSLEVGKRADLILLDANKPHYYPRHNPVSSIAYSAQAADVSTVLVNGKVLMENYEVKTIDVEETMLEGELMAFDLVSRAEQSKVD